MASVCSMAQKRENKLQSKIANQVIQDDSRINMDRPSLGLHEESPLPVIPEPSSSTEEIKQAQKAVMKITKCPHVNRKHYAKNMCSSCYRKYGRNQYAFKCEHTDRLLYSMGMC